MEARRYTFIYKYEESHWWYKGRRILLKNILTSLKINKNAKILDIGCGGGFTLNILNKFGDVSGVDIESKSIKYCRQRGFNNIRLVKNNNKLPFKKNSFDVITCLDVLEHIADDKKYLNELKRVLRPEGYIILFAPAFNFLWGELDILSKHYRRYTKTELINLLKNLDLKIMLSIYFNFLYFLPIFLIRTLQKLPFAKKTLWGINPVIGSRKINSILAAFFSADVFISRLVSPPFGVSLCIVAKKCLIPSVKPSGKNR